MVYVDQLRKARWRGGDLRKMLANSMGSREILEYGASYPEGQTLMVTISSHDLLFNAPKFQ